MGVLRLLGARCHGRHRVDLQYMPSVWINGKEVEWLWGKESFDDFVLGECLVNLIGCLIVGKKLIMSLNRLGWIVDWLLVK
ncbi:hypothetical protein D8674_004081 [Pyrus ussuriensis x Pyrus communis]|uniref:Uncharacterized protein n=1 Tax=Pyrus ussuriensis x Pyrus communis TaxID=2448454 RepID=A0A5N5FIV7_9ROSA|nr:hypothetical protein D8674_004081 [Pyrus ussuriensis x Pyrus communis]